MRLLLLSRGGSSRLFNHGDRIICIHCFKWLEITSPFRKCVSGMEQLSCEKIAHGRTRTHDHTIVIFTTAASDHCATISLKNRKNPLPVKKSVPKMTRHQRIVTKKLRSNLSIYLVRQQPHGETSQADVGKKRLFWEIPQGRTPTYNLVR